MDIIEEIKENVMDGDEEAVEVSIKKALEENIEIEKILNEGLIETMTEVGELWKQDEIFTPEVLISAAAMKKGMVTLEPVLEAQGVKKVGKIVLGTVKSDIHDIGKNLVAMMLIGAGFEVIDVGIDVSEEDFIKAIKEHQPQILGLSALLTTTISQLDKVVMALEEEGIRDQVKVLIGGAPVTDDYAKKIGAEAYAPDAASASQVALELLG